MKKEVPNQGILYAVENIHQQLSKMEEHWNLTEKQSYINANNNRWITGIGGSITTIFIGVFYFLFRR